MIGNFPSWLTSIGDTLPGIDDHDNCLKQMTSQHNNSLLDVSAAKTANYPNDSHVNRSSQITDH